MKKIRANRISKRFFPVRVEVFISRDIFNERSISYTNKLKELDNLQTNVSNYKVSTEQHRTIKYEIERL